MSDHVSVRLGVDLVEVDGVAAALHAHGERYLRRVYTPTEVAQSSSVTGGAPDPERLAARFAAKEAVFKVLRGSVPWTEVETVRQDGGWVELVLHGSARRRATEAGLGALSASLSHERGLAVAVVSGVVSGVVNNTP